MKIQMKVSESKSLDGYIDDQVVPFAVCVDPDFKLSKRQQSYLEKYYDKVVDRAGKATYYCNVINAWKCKDMGYSSIKFADGSEKTIRAYNLERNASVGGKYVVVPHFSRTDKINAVELTKMVRLDVERIRGRVQSQQAR